MAYDKKNKQKLKDKIIELVSDGVSLNRVLKEDKSMPSRPTVFIWLNSNHKDFDLDFSNNYTRARKLRADHIFEELLLKADDLEEDVYVIDDKQFTNHNVINRARLRVDTRKWILGKMDPKKYGDKLDLTTKDGPIVPSEKTTIIFKDGKKKK